MQIAKSTRLENPEILNLKLSEVEKHCDHSTLSGDVILLPGLPTQKVCHIKFA